MDGNKETMASSASGINALAGLWLILAPFILGYSGTAASRNDITIGIIVGIIALVRFFMPTSMTWLSWVNAILGLWLIVAPFFMGTGTTASIWNDVIVGIVIVASSIWSTSATTAGRHTRMGHGTRA